MQCTIVILNPGWLAGGVMIVHAKYIQVRTFAKVILFSLFFGFLFDGQSRKVSSVTDRKAENWELA